MKVLKSILLCVFFISSFFSVHAGIPLSQIKGLASILKPNHQSLSPLNGAVVWNSRFVENLYRYGEDDNPTVKLVKKLFYLQPDNVTFGPIVQVTNLATYFDEELIGKLIKASICEKDEQLKFAKTKKDETLGDARKEAAKDSFEIILNEFFNGKKREEIKEKIKKSNEMHEREQEIKKQEKEDIEKKQKNKGEQLVQIIKKLSVEDRNKLEDDLKNLKNYKKAQGIISNYRDKETEVKSIDNLIIDFLNLINRAQEVTKDIKSLNRQVAKEKNVLQDIQAFVNEQTKELKVLFPNAFTDNTLAPFSAKDILLAMLWRKANSKNDYKEYFKQLDTSFFSDRTVIDSMDWLNNEGSYKPYDKEEMEKIEEIEKPENLPLEDFIVYQAMIAPTNFPPFVRGSNANYEGSTFFDCGETALRNFFNVLLWNSEEHKFDISILTDVFGLDDNLPLVRFYKKYPGTDKIESHDTDNSDANAYDDWAAIVSKVPGIIYRNGGVCNIAGENGVSGIEKIIGYLLNKEGGFNFEKLGKELKNNGIKLYINDVIKDDLGIIEFKLQKTGNEKTFLWKFMLGHLVVDFQYKLDDSDLGILMEQSKRILNVLGDSKVINTERKLLVLLGNNVSKLCHANKESELQKQLGALSADQKVNLILNSNVDYTIGFAIECLNSAKDTDNKTWKTLISKYLKSITLLNEISFKVVKALINAGKDDNFKDELKKIARKITDSERVKWIFEELIRNYGEDNIPKFWVEGFGKLKELDLAGCDLKKIPMWASKFPVLEKLILRSNSDIVFDRKILGDGFLKLKELDLVGCDLKEFPMWTSKFPVLEKLDLGANCDIAFDRKILGDGFLKLKELDLVGCDLKEFPMWASKFPVLEKLILRRNSDIAFDRKILGDGFLKLKELNLIGCGLKKFPMWASKFPVLEVLDLSVNCYIAFDGEISEGDFQNLKELDLVGCDLKKFPMWASKFPVLEKLNLGMNYGIAFDDKILGDGFLKLKELYLGGCNIKDLPRWIQSRQDAETLKVIFDCTR